jgi:hypothetical protein
MENELTKKIESYIQEENIIEIEKVIKDGRFDYKIIYYCNMSIIEKIIEIYNLYNKYFDFNYALDLACERGNMDMVEKIIELSRLNSHRISFDTGLYCACEHGHANIVEKMIKEGSTSFNYGFYYACYGGHICTTNKMIEILKENGNLTQSVINKGLFHAHMFRIMEIMIKLGAKFEDKEYEIKYKKLLKKKKILEKLFISDIVYEIMDYEDSRNKIIIKKCIR